MFNTLRGESGTALVIALSVLAMLSIIGIMSVKTSNIDMELSNFQVNNDKAFYAADAGSKRAIVEVISNPSWNTGYSNCPINNAFYTVVVTDNSTNPALGDTVIITSTGLKEGGRATIEVTLAPEASGSFGYSMFARNGIDVRNKMRTDSYNSDSGSYWTTRKNTGGDLITNGSITIKNGASIGGDVKTSRAGGLNIHTPSDVLGSRIDTSPVLDAPDIPQTTFDSMEKTNDNLTGISGSYSYSTSNHSFKTSKTVTFGDGDYYFSNFIVSNSASIVIAPGAKVNIYISGTVNLKNSGTFNSNGIPRNLTMFIQKNLVLNNSAVMNCVIYAPSAKINMKNSADFYGAIVGSEITCNNSSTFHYDRSLSNMSSGGGTTYKLVAWREL